MTTSPAFLREVADQAALARQQLSAARDAGDEVAASVATGRLLDLDELAGRVTDSILIIPESAVASSTVANSTAGA